MKLGYGFADTLGVSRKKPKVKGENFPASDEFSSSSLNLRLVIFPFVLVALSLLILGRLFYLQVIEGKNYRLLADENRIRVKTMPAPRGIIFDRTGKVLVRNVPGYRLKIKNPECQNDSCPPRFKPVGRDEALEIEAKGGTEAANLEVDILRDYLYPEVLAHVLGYTGEITQEELDQESLDHQAGDKIGRVGIEKEYENILKGRAGKKFIEVDAQEKEQGTLGEVEPQSGKNLTLSIDLDLQKKADEALGSVRGAVVVSNPQNGEILALVSHPSFNPNLFTLGGDEDKITSLLNDKDEMPMMNRTISGLYPPGSTFKIITASAGLETGKITSQTQIEDVGEINIGPYRFPNWYLVQYGKKEEGALDVIRAIARSNDIFFYKTAEWAGEDDLGKWATKFGLGQKLGIDIEGESAGLVPTPNWKEKEIGDKWYLGDTYHMGIGQGYLLATPLQVNFWTSVIASGGTLYEPHLVKDEKPKVKAANFLKKETINLIVKGMEGACTTGGTGWPLFDFKVKDKPIQTACKTGTAEYGEPMNKTHAWFTVYAPASPDASQGGPVDSPSGPEIVVTVLVEGGGEGSSVGGPIAKKILEEWFSR